MTSGKEQFERDFQSFLKEDDSRIAALYRKLPQAEPDPRIDAAVLAMAHRALNPTLVATPLPAPARRRARWLPTMGAAAGLVLAAGVALRVGPQIWNDRDDRNSGAAATPSKDRVIEVRPLDAPALEPPPASPAPPPAQVTALPAAKSVGELRAKPATATPEVARAPRPEAASAPAAIPAERERGDAKELNKADDVTTQAAAPQAFPQRPKPQAEMDAVERKQAIAAGAWQTLPENAARDAAATGTAAPAPAPPPASVSAPVAAAAGAPGFAAQADKKAEPAGTPEILIERIRRELRENHRRAGMRDLAEFRRRYPDYVLPQDLRELK